MERQLDQYLFEPASRKHLELGRHYVFANSEEYHCFKYEGVGRLLELRCYWVLCLDGEPVKWMDV